ncbi:hypothetical protein HPG69_015972 [Diceros bicornis minor]|uniref:Uncharacterized protein n=1 Tax=Diceros bicornis minor TaxID=77932 RepID=A0A7J7EQL6_DICBM|nr:hypothetical protein HPG69_015972 [Diceros bicornis minor]
MLVVMVTKRKRPLLLSAVTGWEQSLYHTHEGLGPLTLLPEEEGTPMASGTLNSSEAQDSTLTPGPVIWSLVSQGPLLVLEPGDAWTFLALCCSLVELLLSAAKGYLVQAVGILVRGAAPEPRGRSCSGFRRRQHWALASEAQLARGGQAAGHGGGIQVRWELHLPVHLLRHAVAIAIWAAALQLPLARHHQASAVHLHHQLLGGEASGIHLHLEAILHTDIVPHSCHIVPQQPHRQRGHLVLFGEGHAGTPGCHPAPVGETATDPLHPRREAPSVALVTRAGARTPEEEGPHAGPRMSPSAPRYPARLRSVQPRSLRFRRGSHLRFGVSYARPTYTGQGDSNPDSPGSLQERLELTKGQAGVLARDSLGCLGPKNRTEKSGSRRRRERRWKTTTPVMLRSSDACALCAGCPCGPRAGSAALRRAALSFGGGHGGTFPGLDPGSGRAAPSPSVSSPCPNSDSCPQPGFGPNSGSHSGTSPCPSCSPSWEHRDGGARGRKWGDRERG